MQGGDVISFVAHLFSLSQYEAAKRLNADFALHLEAGEPTATPRPIRRLDPAAEFEKKVKTTSNNILTMLRILYTWKHDYTPQSLDGVADKWLDAVNLIPYLEDIADRLCSGSIQEKLTAVEDAQQWGFFVSKTIQGG